MLQPQQAFNLKQESEWVSERERGASLEASAWTIDGLYLLIIPYMAQT